MSQRTKQQVKLQDSKTLTRHWDAFGRPVGYSVDGDRKQSITYDPATGRIAESDDIGNRTAAEGKTYTANNLNQYIAIDDFTPEYDADGNQTLIKTETGVWSVVYNAENRPVRWTQGDTVITMAFDRMGRRVEYQETRAGQVVTHFRFVYDNFLCIQRLNADNGNAVRSEFVWDPTEPIATRPLVMRAKNWGLNLFYTHDGNKNVSEVFYHALQNGIAAHYDYAPFGAVTRTSSATRVTNRDFLSENPFRFSSEVHDSTLSLVYYNYRHYSPVVGRWHVRDYLNETISLNGYNGTNNLAIDFLGLRILYVGGANERRSGQLAGFAKNVGAAQEDTFDWSQRSEIQDRIKAILEGNKCEPIVLIGHSWGGDTAAQVARNMGDEICNLTLITLDPVSGVKPFGLEDIANPRRNNIWINVHPDASLMDYVNSVPFIGAWGIGGLISAGIGGGLNLFGEAGSGNNAIAIGGGRWNEESGAQNVNMGELDHHDVDGMSNLTHPGVGQTIRETIKRRNKGH